MSKIHIFLILYLFQGIALASSPLLATNNSITQNPDIQKPASKNNDESFNPNPTSSSADPDKAPIHKQEEKPILVSDLSVVTQTNNLRRSYEEGYKFSKQQLEINKKRYFPTLPPSMPEALLIEEIQKSKERFNSISKTVHLLSSSDNLAFAHHNLSDDDIKNIGLNYIESLDPYHLFFTQKDVNYFINKKSIPKIKESIEGEDLSWVFQVSNKFKENQDIFFNRANEKIKQLPGNEHDSWEVKINEWLDSRDLIHRQNQSIKDDYIDLIIKGQSDLDAKETLIKRYESIHNDSKQLPKIRILEIFLNSSLQYIDPHTAYLAPLTKESFKSMLNKSMDGIGIIWGMKNNLAIIDKVIPNSPAENAEIKAGDQIYGIGDTKDNISLTEGKSFEEIKKMFEDSFFENIFLTIKNSTGETNTVELKKEKLKLSESVVSKKIINSNKGNKKLKVLSIDIPIFYKDPENTNRLGGSAALDVKNIIKSELDSHNPPDLLLLDLRGNGGGLMSEAIDLASLFLDNGIIMSIKDALGNVQVIELAKENEAIWHGPMAVLIDSRSASASEIVAAALQDNNRAIIVGQQSYGKGSAQTLFDLDFFSGLSSSVFGQLNLTTMVFFRPSGISTQLKGISPDVKIGRANNSYGEIVFDNPIQNQQLNIDFTYPSIKPVNLVSPWQSRRVSLQENSNKRWKNNFWYTTWKDLTQENKKTKSLNVEIRSLQQQLKLNKGESLASSWKKDGEIFNDGLGEDVIQREAMFVAFDAFFPENNN